MNKVFYRPLIIVVIAVILVELIARVIPDSDNKIFPIKKLSWLESIEPKDTIEPTDTIVVKEATAIPNNLLPLQPFIQKMNNSAKSIRIAYYGDSIIEGDLITGKLRQELQSVHSGSGVGMIGVQELG